MSIRVLIIDDEELICKSIKSLVERLDIAGLDSTIYTTDPNAALRMITESGADIVITDIRMPEMDGLTLIESTEGLVKRPQFIILSGYEDFHYARKALKLNVVDYLLKPVGFYSLKEAVLTAIKSF